MSWPRALVAVFLVFFASQVTLFAIAVRHFEAPDEAGFKHGLSREAALPAPDWTLAPSLTKTASGTAARVQVTDGHGRPLRGARAWVVVGRPATTRDDRRIALSPDPAGYAATFALAPGAWTVTFTVARDGGQQERALRWTAP